MEAQAHGAPEAFVHALICAHLQLRSPPEVVALLLQLGGGSMSADVQALLLRQCIRHPLALVFPASREYKSRLLRAVVLAAEQGGHEVDEELMSEYSACLLTPAALGQADSEQQEESDSEEAGPLPASQLQPGWACKLWYYSPAGTPAQAMPRLAVIERASLRARHAVGDACHGLLALHVSANMLEGSTGCHEWEAGFFLAEFVLSRPDLFAGASCLELGCGAGMVGVALHRAGAARVLLTDGDAQTVDNCCLNLKLNGIMPITGGAQDGSSGAQGAGQPGIQPSGAANRMSASGVACRQLRWEDGNGGEAPDCVLAADVLYNPEAIPPLLALLKQLLVAGGSTSSSSSQPAAYIATTRRNEATLQAFLAAVAAEPELAMTELTGLAEAGQPAGGGTAPAEEPAMDQGAAEPAMDQGAAEPRESRPAVHFHHHPALEAARSRVLLHRLQLAGC